MTNREWLNTLTDEEFIEIMTFSPCDGCVVGHEGICRSELSCMDGRLMWLQAEHKEKNDDK